MRTKAGKRRETAKITQLIGYAYLRLVAETDSEMLYRNTDQLLMNGFRSLLIMMRDGF